MIRPQRFPCSAWARRLCFSGASFKRNFSKISFAMSPPSRKYPSFSTVHSIAPRSSRALGRTFNLSVFCFSVENEHHQRLLRSRSVVWSTEPRTAESGHCSNLGNPLRPYCVAQERLRLGHFCVPLRKL